MAKLGELRDHFSGAKPLQRKKKRRRHPPVDPERVRLAQKQHFTISTNGEDALLKFGKHAGESVSDLAEQEPGYLRWVLREQDGKLSNMVDEDLVDVITYQLQLNGQRIR